MYPAGSTRSTSGWSLLLWVSVLQLLSGISSSSSSSSSSQSSLPSAGCEAERAACENDPACQTCSAASFESTYSYDCSDRYPSLWQPWGEGSIKGTFCEITGAYFCCEFPDDHFYANDCLANFYMAGLQSCMMAQEGCEFYDMPCYMGEITLPPATSSPSSAATLAPPVPASSPLPTAAPLPSSAATPHPTAAAACDSELRACESDTACQPCLVSTPSSATDCSIRYPDLFEALGYYEGGGSNNVAGSFCEVTGADLCCEFDDNLIAEDCLGNPFMASYQACAMAEEGCVLDDMPCYGNPEATTTPVMSPSPTSLPLLPSATMASPLPSATPAPVGILSPPSTTPSSATTAAPAPLPSSTAAPVGILSPPSATSPPTASSTCADLAVACQDDVVCQTCLASLSDTSWSDCRDRYPDLYEPLGGENGLSGSFCELAGAEICCQFDDKASAAGCLENGAMAAYYECQMADDGCLLDDMPCYGDLVTTDSSAVIISGGITTTPAPATSAASSSSAGGARGFDLTPSPVADNTRETVDFANGATRAGLALQERSSMAGVLLSSVVAALAEVLA